MVLDKDAFMLHTRQVLAFVSSYFPESSLGWFDLDAAASERVATMLRALDEPGTLDVLGLGTVRDALSNLLAPGTSTIQTRLRYFLFIPWIFETLPQSSSSGLEPSAALRLKEIQLIERLAHLGADQGVIGFVARAKLKRMPTEAYWAGLGQWGIRSRDITIRQYAQMSARPERVQTIRDDDHVALEETVPLWSRLPSPPSGFLDEDLAFDLTADEADFLLDRIRISDPDSLLARYAGIDVNLDDVAYPWGLPEAPAGSRLRTRLWHAQNFAELTTGSQQLYNLLLARRARAELGWDTDDLEAHTREELDHWAQRIERRELELRQWVDEIADFWSFLGDGSIHPRTKEFVEEITRRAIDNPTEISEDLDLADRVAKRELQLKSKRARLAHRSALENWNGSGFGGQFAYRWGTVRSYLADLHAAGVGST
jgi:hypothetical protein